MPRMCGSGSWRTSQRGLGALHHVLRGSSFAPGGASSSRCRGTTSRTSSAPASSFAGPPQSSTAARNPRRTSCSCSATSWTRKLSMSPGVASYAPATWTWSARTVSSWWRASMWAADRSLRRLGLRRLARRFSSRSLPWSELYAASPAAHTVQLRVDRERLAGLGPAGLAQVIGRLPPAHGADVLRSVGSELAADAVSGTHPEVGGRVVGELGSEAAPIVERMAPDDAAAALRHVDADDQHDGAGAHGNRPCGGAAPAPGVPARDSRSPDVA